MPNHIVQVSISARLITGAPLPRARVRFDATGPDIDAAIVVPGSVTTVLDDNGNGVVTIRSNAAGTQGRQTRVAIYSESNELKFDGLATVPSTDCNLHEILNLLPPARIDDAQAAALAAQYWASQAAAFAGLSGVALDGGAPNSTYTNSIAIDGGTP